jgi:hypothetical protein
MTRGRKDAAVLTRAQFMTLQLSSVVAAILEAIHVTKTKNVAMAPAATRPTAKNVTERPVLVKAGVSRNFVKNATGMATAYPAAATQNQLKIKNYRCCSPNFTPFSVPVK